MKNHYPIYAIIVPVIKEPSPDDAVVGREKSNTSMYQEALKTGR
jgi:hypothetical protein